MHILLADDDEGQCRLVEGLLLGSGHSVETARDGREALRLLHQRDFDVVLRDICMPGVGGIELLREVRQRDLDVPVLLMTARPEVETAIEAVTHGATRYIAKPISPPDLQEAVREAGRLRWLTLAR